MWDKIRKTRGPVLLMAILLFIGVAYSVYRAATAFSVEVDSPGYELTPSNLVVSPELETVIPENDPIAIRADQQGFRLPDEAIFAISEGTNQIAEDLENNKLRSQTLQNIGYLENDATDQALALQSLYNGVLAGEEFEVKRQISIDAELSSVDYAQSTLSLEFIPEDGGEIRLLTIYIGWEPLSGSWVPVAFSDNAL